MTTLLPAIKNVITKNQKIFSVAVLLLMLFGISQNLHAQVYYMQNSGKGNVSDADNVIKKIDYTGTGDASIVGGFPNPVLFELDIPNNRAFVYNGFLGSRVINVVNMSNGAVTNTITLPSGIQVSGPSVTSIKYDPINNWVYYITNSGTGVAGELNAIYRSRPDGTSNAALATNIALLPNWLALDIPNNRVFINEAIFSARKMLTFNLGTNTITASPSMSNIINAISYDAATDYLYYITSDNDQLNTGTTNGTTNDALRKMRPDGSGGEIVVKSSVVISPQYLALDAGNNRAYIYNGYYGGSTTIRITTTGIYSVDLTTGATALKLDHAGLQNTPNYLRVMGLYAPARPMVNTTAVTAFSSGSATLGGDVTRSDASVTERGFVYSSSNQTPTIGDGVIQAANGSGTGLFSQPISGLSPSTLYYVRAYATSSAGTSYGSANNFYTLSNDANLSGLGISAGTLNPAFSSATTSFTASVPNSTTSITVTPTKNNVLASIKVNGVTVNSGSPSDAIALNVGSNVITTVVTAQDGGVTKTYTLTVTRAKTPQTISFSLPAKNYGNADFSPGATSSEGLTVSYSSDNSAVATIVNNQVHIVAPGTANITASQAGDATRLAATNVVQSLTVDKGTVTVTANAQTKVYGNNDPVFTYTATGVVGTDAATGSLSRQDPTTNKFVGDYVITQGTLSYGDKYNITYVSANLTITKRPFTIRPVGATKVFADADPNFISFFTDGTSLAAGDATTGNFARSPGENVGAYATLIGQKRVLSMSTYADVTANYSINFVSTNTFVITPKQINVTANPALKAYGTADPVFTYAVPSDVTDATFTGSLSRTAGEEPGQYALTQGTLAINSNYTFNFISDNLTIGPQTLVLTPNAATKVYGNADPVYTFSTNVPIVGNATFTGTPTRAEGKTVGSYAIDGLGTVALDNPRYVLAFAAGGSLTITKRPITLEPVPATKSYGNADPGFPYRFIDGTSVAPGEGMTGTFGRAAGENVGTYALTLGQKSPVNASTGVPTKANYEITFISADLTITPTRLDITATNLSKSFGDEDPSFTYSINQTLVDGDAPTGTLVRALGETRGGYPINQGTLSFGNNYQIFFNGGTFTIGKKTIDVTANALTKTYGTGDPELTYTISESPVGESITGAPGRASGENVGTYAISKGTLSLSDNYVINFTGNDFNINKAQLSYVANPASKPFYTANPTFTGSVTGFANGETIETATTGTLAFSSPALLNSPRGIYPITGSGLSADNYDFIQAAGNSTALSIVASADNTLSALTATKGTLTPVFSPSVLNYGFGVANNVTSFDLSATLNSSFATATINGVPYVSGSTKTLPLAAGGNQFAIVVTAQDETTQTYSLNIYRAYSTNNLLSSLVVNGATISPAFDPDVTSYRASVPHSTGSVSMYGIAADSTAVVKGYDGTVATAENPFTYELSVGEYNYNLIVTSESGANRFYTVLIDRAKSPDATLASFGSELVTMTSPIVDGTLNYSGTVTHTTSNDRFNPASSSGRASLKVWVNDQPVDSYGGYYMLFGFGTNKLTVEVTSEDGNNTKTYNLNVVREKSNNARLANLYIPFLEGGLDQSFDGDVYAYTANMADSIYTGLPLRLHAENDFATVKVNGLAVPRFQDYQMVLHGGPNTFNIVVTSQDGSQTKTYQLVFTRGGTPPPAKSPVARLASLNVSAAPSFSKNFNLSYEELTTINAPNSVASVRFFLNKEHPNSTITLNGAAYDAEINESDLHPIVVGDNLFTVVVTAEDGVVTKTYEVHVNRLPYVNVDLASLSINRGPLTPVFSAATTTYNVSVPNNVETVTVTPTVANAGNTVQVNGTTIDAANPTATVNVFTGPPTRIRTVVRSADGVTSKTYTIVVTRLPSDDATLSSLGASSAVSPVFSAAVTNYTATVGSAVTTYTIAPLVNHPGANAVVTVNGAPYNSEETPEIALEMGLTTIVTTVTANNGVATKTYTLKVYRGSNVATASLAIDTRTPLTVTTGTGYRNFVTSVDFNATSISVKPTLTDLNAIVTVNGSMVASGAFSEPITLNPDSTLINILVTAQDGVTTKLYTINVKREGASVATASLALDTKDALTVTTGTGYRNFVTSINFSTTEIRVKPTLTDPNATVKVNGSLVASGEFSEPVALSPGSTLINILVTAQDGITTKLYTINVKREGASIATASLALDTKAALTVTTGTGYRNFVTSINFSTTEVRVKPTLTDPNATVTVNGNLVASGEFSEPVTLSPDSTLINVMVTAQDGVTTKLYTINVKREGASVATASLALDTKAALTVTTGTGYRNFVTSINFSTTEIRVKPTLTDPNATVTVNGSLVASGEFSEPVTLNPDSTLINVLVTAQDGVSTKLYTINVKREGASIATASLALDPKATLTLTTGTGFRNYVTSIDFNTTSISVKPTLTDPNATVVINGVAATSGVFSTPISLNVDSTMISVVVTAQDGITIKTYKINVKRAGANISTAAFVMNTKTPLTITTGTAYRNYITTVAHDVNSVMVKPQLTDPNASIKINGVTATSGVFSAPINLNADSVMIDIVVTAQDGITTRTYGINVKRKPNNTIMVNNAKPENTLIDKDDRQANAKTGVMVHQGLSPNGDGINDNLIIEGLEQYSDNQISIINSKGMLVYKTAAYGSNGNVFDGHQNNGTMLVQGTYYYILEYKKGKNKTRKTGYIILKY